MRVDERGWVVLEIPPRVWLRKRQVGAAGLVLVGVLATGPLSTRELSRRLDLTDTGVRRIGRKLEALGIVSVTDVPLDHGSGHHLIFALRGADRAASSR